MKSDRARRAIVVALSSKSRGASTEASEFRSFLEPFEGLPWTAILAVSSSIGYVWALLYQTGYGHHFSLPMSTVRISSETIARTVLIVAAILLFLSLYLVLSIRQREFRRLPVRARDWGFLGLSLLVVGVLMPSLLSASWPDIFGYPPSLGFGLLPIVPAAPCLVRAVWLARQARVNPTSDTAEKAAVRAPVVRGAATVLLIVFGGIWLPYLTGRVVAARTTEYLVARESREVVLAMHGDTALVAEFDPATRELSGVFRYMSIESTPGASQPSFHLEFVGPLVVSDPE